MNAAFWTGVGMLLVALAVYGHERLRRIELRDVIRRKFGFVCYHDLPITDCGACKVGVTRDEFTRAERRRTERHNVRVAKKMHKQKRWLRLTSQQDE